MIEHEAGPETPDEITLMSELVRSKLAQIHTAIPGTVLAYDEATQRATVQVTVCSSYRNAAGERVCYQPPPISNVPVHFPGSSGGSFSITWPLAAGDEVLLICSERSLDEYLATGERSVEPQDLRRFDLTDAIALPGQLATQLPAEALDSAGLVLRGSEVFLGSSAATAGVAHGDVVDTELGRLKTAFQAWTPVPLDGGAALKTILTALFGTGWPVTTESTNIKTE